MENIVPIRCPRCEGRLEIDIKQQHLPGLGFAMVETRSCEECSFTYRQTLPENYDTNDGPQPEPKLSEDSAEAVKKVYWSLAPFPFTAVLYPIILFFLAKWGYSLLWALII